MGNNIQNSEIESSEIISEASSSQPVSEAASEIVLESGEEISIDAENATTTSAIASEAKEWPEGGKDAFFDHSLPILGLGMLGIFIVLGLIAIATISINKLFPAKKKDKDD